MTCNHTSVSSCYYIGIVALMVFAIAAQQQQGITNNTSPPAGPPPGLAQDVEALMDFFQAMEGAARWPPVWREHWQGGATSSRLSPYTICDPFLDWHGTVCDPHTKRIVRLMHRSGLAAGKLPSTLGKLTKLEVLDLSENDISGTLPAAAIEGWRGGSMVSMALSGNRLAGTLPSQLSMLKGLKYLILSRNDLEGGVLDATLSQMESLEVLFLDNNRFTGSVPSLSTLRNLRHVKLDGNEFTGVVPDNFLASAQQLVAVELADNPDLAPLPAAVRARLAVLPYATFGATQKGEKVQRAPPVDGADGGVSAPLRFLAMGDFGTGGQWLGAAREIASAFHFNRYAAWLQPSFTVTVGDNLYVYKNQYEADFFRESFEKMFASDALMGTPWYPAIGNHDRYRPQIEYSARSPRWRFTTTEYDVRGVPLPHRDFSDSDNFTLDIFVHDNLHSKANIALPLLNRLRAGLNYSTARYKLLFAHYPIVSSGCHKTEKGAKHIETLVTYEKKYNISAMFFGHDHHSEALFSPNDHSFHFLVGSFSRGPCVSHDHPFSLWKDKLLGGFATVTADPFTLNVTHISEHGAMMFHTVVPFDWAERRMERPPSMEEVAQYVAMNKFPSLHVDKATAQKATTKSHKVIERATAAPATQRPQRSGVEVGNEEEEAVHAPPKRHEQFVAVGESWMEKWLPSRRFVYLLSTVCLVIVPLLVIYQVNNTDTNNTDTSNTASRSAAAPPAAAVGENVVEEEEDETSEEEN